MGPEFHRQNLLYVKQGDGATSVVQRNMAFDERRTVCEGLPWQIKDEIEHSARRAFVFVIFL